MATKDQGIVQGGNVEVRTVTPSAVIAPDGRHVEMARPPTPLTSLLMAAIEYGDSFEETDQKKESSRREKAHKALCRTARLYAASRHEEKKGR